MGEGFKETLRVKEISFAYTVCRTCCAVASFLPGCCFVLFWWFGDVLRCGSWWWLSEDGIASGTCRS
jgi:hypothetical protein